MKCFVGLLLLLVLLGVHAYDFDDSAFNEYLFKELQSHYEGEELYTHRTRREATEANECAKRSWKKDMQCCKNGNVSGDQWELFKSVKKQCIADLKGEPADDAFDPFDCGQMQKVKKQLVCITECVAKRFKSLDENGELQRDAILEGLRGQIGTVQWKLDAIEGYVDKCLTEVKVNVGQKQKWEGCNPLPISFHSCMWRQFWNGCPADLRVDTPKCNKMRERVAIGDTRFFGKHFLNKYYPSPRDDE
uniref:Odorant-binding protein n=1 Tax=Zeugodacus tau TaxID=137263 RepID=A0A6M9TZR2_ZEUTA|nr:odorant-binding protein [Zeugodacus tau]